MSDDFKTDFEKELRKNYKKGLKKIPFVAWFIIPFVLLLSMLAFSINFRVHARATGGTLGTEAGTLAGRAAGSLEGLTKGRDEGFQAGKEEGLSGKDTTVELSQKIRETAKLEVLVASGTFVDMQTIGNKNDPDYAVLLSLKYNAVFSVDLESADIALTEDNVLHITLDAPVVEPPSVSQIERKKEYQRPGFIFKTGSAQGGYEATLNSMQQLVKTGAVEKLQSDASLMEAAKLSAKNQLQQLANAVSLLKPEVKVTFR